MAQTRIERIGKFVIIGLPVAAILIQAIRPDRTNPPENPARAIKAATYMTPDVSAILDRACADCHSYRTVWPWYSSVAPVSWFVANDVHEGRSEFSMSDWASYDPRRASRKLDSLCEHVKAGSMPPTTYVLMHSNARLSEADRQVLCGWSEAAISALKAP